MVLIRAPPYRYVADDVRIELGSKEPEVGLIVGVDTGRQFPLAARSLIGRGSQCHIRLDVAFVSREHAAIEYIDGYYYIKDLSSNGVTIGGRPIERGALILLKKGTEVSLGHGSGVPRLELLDDTPPRLLVHELDSQRILVAPAGGMLRLCPESANDEPEASVDIGYDEHLGAFMFPGGESDKLTPLRNEQIVRVGSSLWMVHLPADVDRTSPAKEFPIDLRQATLKLITDEAFETVEVRLLSHSSMPKALPNAERTIVSRSRYAETLLALALRKRDDLAAGVPEHNAGWLSNDALRDLVGSSRDSDANLPYLHPFRLKRLFETANVRGLASLFERERGMLRLGLRDFEVVVREEPSTAGED